jgi:hypothetical protein
MASPPHDPPAASGKPLQGQRETNQPLEQTEERPEVTRPPSDDDQTLWRAAAMDLGRMIYSRHAGESLHFNQAEEELASEWETQQEKRAQRVSWERARDLAQDAWNQARSALLADDAKPSAR